MKKQIFISYGILLICIAAFYYTNNHFEKRLLKDTLRWQDARNETVMNSKYLRLVKRFYAGKNLDTYEIGKSKNNDWQLSLQDFPDKLGTLYYQENQVNFVPNKKVSLDTNKDNKKNIQIDIKQGSKSLSSEKLDFINYSVDYTWDIQNGVKFNIYSRKQFRLVVPEAEDYFIPSRKYKVKAKFVHNPKQLKHPQRNYTYEYLSDSPGYLKFKINGIAYQLDVYSKSETDYFLVFGDKTNNKETYGAGRFLQVPIADNNGNTEINFNEAFNPWCVFNGNLSCPMPAETNILPIHIEAGEKYKKQFRQL